MMNGTPNPDIARPRLVWGQPWSHEWNRAVLFMLSQKFLADIQSGTRPLLSAAASRNKVAQLDMHVSTLSPATVQNLIQNKLKRTQGLSRRRAKAASESHFQSQIADRNAINNRTDRQSSRRHAVSSILVLCALLMIFVIAL